MANISVAAEWKLLYDRYYRKRDDSKIVQLHCESALRKLRIFSFSGPLLADTIWCNPGGHLIGMSWTDDHTLVCVIQDGFIYRYDVHAHLIELNLSLGKECFESNVDDCAFWGNNVVSITKANELFCIANFKNPTAVKLTDPGLLEPSRCMVVIEPQYTMSGNVELLLGVGDGSEEDEAVVLAVEEDGLQRLGVGMLRGPLQKMVVSRDAKWLASFTHDGKLLVTTLDLTETIIERECEVGDLKIEH